MGKARKPIIGVTYKQVDITSDITYFLRKFIYRDKLDSDSPDIELEFEDREKLWQNEWFPKTGDEVSVTLKYESESEVVLAHNFEVDLLNFTFTNQGDIFILGAQQTPFSKNLREKRSKEYENVTLEQIIEEISQRQGLIPVGQVPLITFKRITQNEESDLEFITRLSDDYGQIFKVQGNQLIFFDRFRLNADPPLYNLGRGEITRFEATKKLTGIYNSAKLVYEGTDGEPIIGAIIRANPLNNSQDVLIINEKVENDFQAVGKAQEKLRRANADEYSGTLELEGSARYIAGLNFTLFDFGVFNGVWQIQEVEHTFAPDSGWKSSVYVYRLRD